MPLQPNQDQISFTIDLTNAPLYGVLMDLPAGVHKGKITALKSNKEGNAQVGVVTSGGLPTSITLGTDDSKAGNQGNWLKLALSTGAPEEKVRGKVTFTTQSLVGKEVYIYAKDRAEGEEYQDRRFITPKEAQELMQQQAPKGANGGNGAQAAAGSAAVGAAAGAATPQPGAGGFSL